MRVYPIFLNNLAGRRCVVVGGGHEAERKVRGLLDCDASVTLICPNPPAALLDLVREERIDWIGRRYERGDLRDAFLVVVTEPQLEDIEALWEEGNREKALINTMDDVPHCSFVAGSVVKRGKLVVSISTSGAAPALSVRLRQQLERQLDDDYESFLNLMAELRGVMASRFPDFEERRRRWYEIVDSDILPLLSAGNRSAAYELLARIIGDLPEKLQTAMEEA